MKTALALGALLGAVVLTGGGSAAAVAPCTATQLTGTFRAIPGSAGAGSISYRLRLANRSPRACSLSGYAGLRLLGRTGQPLPTKVTRDLQGPPFRRVVVAPGKAARADARFSPDVPGPGEPVSGTVCEPKAYRVRVTLPRDGTLVAPVSPPTPVCEHGAILLRAFRAA